MRQPMLMQIPVRRADGVRVELNSVDFADSGLRREHGKHAAAAVKFDEHLRFHLFHNPQKFRREFRRHLRVDLEEGAARNRKLTVRANGIGQELLRILRLQQKRAVMRRIAERQSGNSLRK